MNKRTILFLCTHNAARSQIAEAFINARFGDRYEAHSAGNEPTEVHPCAIKVMAELGIDISRQRPQANMAPPPSTNARICSVTLKASCQLTRSLHPFR